MFSENVSSAGNQQERALLSESNLGYYIAGFVDGDGCFSVTIHKSKYRKLGWNINPLFQVYQHKDNSEILKVIKNAFKCGYISEKGGNPLCHVYCVDRISDLILYVIPFFQKYALISNKRHDFDYFTEIVMGISKSMHLDADGFIELSKKAFKMNRGGKYRKYKLDEIIPTISLRQSSEAKRQTQNNI